MAGDGSSAGAVVRSPLLGQGPRPAQPAALFVEFPERGAVPRDYRCDRFGRGLVHLGYDAGVDIAGETRLAVTEDLADDLHVDAAGERQGGGAVPEVVVADWRERLAERDCDGRLGYPVAPDELLDRLPLRVASADGVVLLDESVEAFREVEPNGLFVALPRLRLQAAVLSFEPGRQVSGRGQVRLDA